MVKVMYFVLNLYRGRDAALALKRQKNADRKNNILIRFILIYTRNVSDVKAYMMSRLNAAYP
ncbi:hypothetical protein D3C81_1719260 [compost metagenome]